MKQKILLVTSVIFICTVLGCGKAQENEQVSVTKNETKAETSAPKEQANAPRDEFHGYAQGKSSPGDPDFHKGSYIDEKVGLNQPKKQKVAKKQLKTPDDVIQFYSDILRETPEDASAWVMVGGAYLMKKDYVEAIKKFKQALKLKDMVDAYSNIGFAYSGNEDFDDALESHTKALKMDPGFSNSYYGLALVYEKKTDFWKAAKNWEKYLELEDKKANKNTAKLNRIKARVAKIRRSLNAHSKK